MRNKFLPAILFLFSTAFLGGCWKKENIQPEPEECIHSHVIIDDAVDPTCTKYGLTAGSHCEDCGAIIIKQEVINPLGHVYVIDEAVESTCSFEGKTVGLHCSRCEEVLIEQDCVSKKPHTKGELIDLPVHSIENIENPGLFECSVCHEHYYDTVTYEDIGVPVLSINGDLSNISKENKVCVTTSYTDENQSFDLCATLKLQGASSIGYPKKNYNIQFFKDDTYASKQKVQLVEAWGKQNKYTLKANWVDFSEMRNVVSGKIYGDVVHSRHIDDNYDKLVNGGAIDGYATLLFQNGVYQGLYTLNTSKDDYLFGMNGDETTREALLMVNDWSSTGALYEHIPEGFGPTWELEYSSTEDNAEIGNGWVISSFNEMMDFVLNNDGQAFVDGIEHFINVPRTIDSMLYTWAIHANDNVSKNILWSTYDGVQWTPSVYDMDGVWGCYWDGSMTIIDVAAWIPYTGNALWVKIYNNMQSEVISRWEELRNGPLSLQNIDRRFVEFYNTIPGRLYNCERARWPSVPSQYTNHVVQVANWATDYFHNMDVAFGVVIDDQPGYKVNIVGDGHVQVRAYISNDYSKDPCLTSVAYSRDSETGLLTTSSGQLNFLVIVEQGYQLGEIEITGSYKNLKGKEDTGLDNVYRITKISSNLTVNISTSQLSV